MEDLWINPLEDQMQSLILMVQTHILLISPPHFILFLYLISSSFSTPFHSLSLPPSILFHTSFYSLCLPPSIHFLYLLMHSICHGFPVYLFCFLIFLQLLPPFASQYIYVFIIYLRNFLFSFLFCCYLSLFLLVFLSTYICFS